MKWQQFSLKNDRQPANISRISTANISALRCWSSLLYQMMSPGGSSHLSLRFYPFSLLSLLLVMVLFLCKVNFFFTHYQSSCTKRRDSLLVKALPRIIQVHFQATNCLHNLKSLNQRRGWCYSYLLFLSVLATQSVNSLGQKRVTTCHYRVCCREILISAEALECCYINDEKEIHLYSYGTCFKKSTACV